MVYKTFANVVRGKENAGMHWVDVIETDGELWAVLEWFQDRPATRAALNRKHFQDMGDGTYLYQFPIHWPEAPTGAG